MDIPTFRCSCCGEDHSGTPDWAFDEPFQYHALSAAEREDARLTSDFCEIGEDRFVRGLIPLRVGEEEAGFCFGVWVSLSQANFERYQVQYEKRTAEQDAPWFGWLCNRIPGYPDTLNLKTHVVLQPDGTRPHILLEPTAHPLAVEQRQGISTQRLQAILELLEHPPAAA